MKPSSVLLLVSFAANAVLLVLAVQRPASPSFPAPARAAAPAEPARPVAAATKTDAASTRSPVEPAAPWWTQLSSDDPRELVRRLTAAGFPRAVVRTVVEQELNRRTQEKRRELLGDEPQNYWQARRPPTALMAGPDFARRMSAIENEQQSALREALGPDYLLEDDTRVAWLRRLYGVNDRQKLARLQAIVSDYQQVGNDTSRDGPAPANRELREETRQLLQREQLADIAALLTPEEFAEYGLRASPAAQSLRNQLREFRASEDEYRALFAAYRATEDPAARGFNPQKLLEQARLILPPERIADLQQALAPGAAKLNRLAGRLGLPLAAIAPVDTAQQELKQRANDVRRDPVLTAEQRNAQLAAIANEATHRITAALGDRGFAAYRDYDGGWIGELTAPPVARP